MTFNALSKYKQTALYGVAMALLLFLLQWLELRFIIFDHAFEVYAGAIALIFTGLGVWLAQKLLKPKVKTVVVEKPVFVDNSLDFTINTEAAEELRISKRELEVLQLMGNGLSNREIADKLFVSLNTIKTHSSNLFEKLEAERRTQAVEKAKRLGLIC